MKEKTILLVDGSSYLFRAYYALPPLTNSRGEQTGAVYGVMNMLRHLQKKVDTSHIAIVFDSKGKTFRHKMYPDYKANRAAMPEDLQEQIKPLHRLIKDFGFPLLVKPGVEADDVIGSLAHCAVKQGYRVIISTGDKDFAQLVGPKLTLVNTMNWVTLDEKGVEEKFGVPPSLIVDYLALMGDTVDNVPGVPKVGPKTALKWLLEYGSLDAVMQQADQIKGKVGENLRASLDFLPMARDLVTIAEDIELEEKTGDLVLQAPNRKRILKAVQHLEFRTWSKEFADADGAVPAAEDEAANPASSAKDGAKKIIANKKGVHYEMITTEEQLSVWVAKLKKAKTFALDTETTSLDAMQADLVGISLAVEAKSAAYIPLGHETTQPQLELSLVLTALAPLLQNNQYCVIGQNLKYDYKVLARAGVKITAALWDTMLASYVLDAARSSHGLDALADSLLGYQTTTYEEVAGKGAKQICFSQVALDVATNYAAEDADITWRLYELFLADLKKEKKLHNIFNDIEMPLLTILAEMEYAGVMIDPAMLHQQSRGLYKRMAVLQKIIYELAGEEFNISSPKQLQHILYDKLKCPVLKKTPTGQPATSEPVLKRLAGDYPLPSKVLAYRSLSKLKTTYTDRLPEQIDADTDRIHTSYRQTGTVTGRLSSSDPNLQNIPIRTEEGRKVREAFIAPRGYRLLAADYSQIELRLMAHFSGDHGLMRAFESNLDVHQATAADIFSVTVDEVTADMRRQAKTINFGLMYGMSAFGLSQQLQISRHDAAQFIETYFMRYPKVQHYLQQVREQATEQGYVETLSGRRIMLPDLASKKGPRRAAAERAAINAPLQGTAADIIKLAMIAIETNPLYQTLKIRMIMQVHDELVFEVHKDDCAKAEKIIVHLMENAVQLKVLLQVVAGTGKSWGQAHP